MIETEPGPGRPRLAKAGKVLSAMSTAALWLAGAGLVLMTIIVGWQVFTRYVLNWSNAWTEPAALLLMSWFIFLGAAVGIRENYHLGFDVLLYVVPRKAKLVLRAISDVVVVGFAIGMIVYGMELTVLGWNARMPSIGIPDGVKYLPLVGGGVLIVLFSVERFVLRLAGVSVDKGIDLEEIPSEDAVREA
ncbi:MAG TPA: TRAP transporter small permease [Devosiaceae bacterium]|jgi:TRAP-type C4-dicarboxylate transport system permease small subunit|nr:TRAP transporter small permease [Devosiaceae bacterium]